MQRRSGATLFFSRNLVLVSVNILPCWCQTLHASAQILPSCGAPQRHRSAESRCTSAQFVRCNDPFTFKASSRFCSNPPQFWGAETTSLYRKRININSSSDVVPSESHRGDVALPEFGPLIGRLDLIGLRETSTPPD